MRKIRPIVIYHFHYPNNHDNLNALYLSLHDTVTREHNTYDRPITIFNRQTYYNNKCSKVSFTDRYDFIKQYSDIVDAWCVDTCQMWLTGFGTAYHASHKSAGPTEEDIFWLIPGDFDYATGAGKDVLKKMYDLPRTVMSQAEFCIGQLEMRPNSAKQLIDTYGTYGLLFRVFRESSG